MIVSVSHFLANDIFVAALPMINKETSRHLILLFCIPPSIKVIQENDSHSIIKLILPDLIIYYEHKIETKVAMLMQATSHWWLIKNKKLHTL